MLPKKRRISRAQFSKIIANGRRYSSPSFVLYVFLVEKNTSSKIAFSVSKKIQNKATKRNKLRRWGYSAISLEINSLKEGCLLFFSFKKTKEEKTFERLQKEIKELLYVSGVLI